MNAIKKKKKNIKTNQIHEKQEQFKVELFLQGSKEA